jgi:putative ABC transport system permease protein
MGTLRQDVLYATRMLSKSLGFTIAAVATLALGIGANTAIFSVVNSVLIRPLPYPNANRLVMVWETHATTGEKQNTTSPATFWNWREQNTVFQQLAGLFNNTGILTGGAPEQVAVQVVTPNLFSMLGVNAVLGRTFLSPQDDKDGADQIAVLSFDLWQRRFGSDPSILGTKVMLDGKPRMVVGVMPRGFRFFVKQGSFGQKPPEIWTPMTFSEKDRAFTGRYMQAIGLLRPGITLAQAQSSMSSLALSLEKQDPASMKDWGVNLVPLRRQLVGNIETSLQVLFGAVGLVLLIGCANLAILLLARAKARSQEIAVRIALGARPWHVIRQMLTESFLLAGLGGASGVLLAFWSVKALLVLAPKDLVPLEGSQIDLAVLGFATGMAVLTALLFGTVPALHACHIRPNEQLKEAGRSGRDSAQGRNMRSVFVVAQMAAALVLLIGAGLLIRSFARLLAVDPGFQPKDILTFRVQLPTSKYHTDQQISEFYAQLLEHIRQLPGVQSASADAYLPLTGVIAGTGVDVEGRPLLPASEQPIVDVTVVEPKFFETLGIPLLRGRSFSDREAREVSHKVVISQAMAKQLWPNEDPIGKHVTIHMKEKDEPSEVVGVVGDVKHAGLDTEIHPTAYWAHPELAYPFMTLVVRTTGDPLALVPAIRQVVLNLDKDQPLSDIDSMESLLSNSLARARFSTVLLGIFAGMALLLAVIGIYAVVSHSVRERTHEIGIRVAVGAQQADVIRMILRNGLALAGSGAAIGAVTALAVTRVMTSLLFGTSSTDPTIFIGVICFLTSVALVACYFPARRASKVDPMVALRYE